MSVFSQFAEQHKSMILNEDGIVNEAIFNQQKHKILFVLKETNKMQDMSLKQFLNDGAYDDGVKTFQPLCHWINALLNGRDDLSFSTAEERKVFLQKVAVINCKKEPGESKSDNSYVEWAKIHKEFLKDQINEIDPSIIVFCCPEAFDFVSTKLLEIDQTTLFKSDDLYCYKWNSKLIIFARHPHLSENIWRTKFINFHNNYLT